MTPIGNTFPVLSAAGELTGVEEEDRNHGEPDENADRVKLREKLQTRQPLGIAHAKGLESAPEPVRNVKIERDEPGDIENRDHWIRKSSDDELIRIFSLSSQESLELHVLPEVHEVEEKEKEDDDAEYEHVLGSPGGRLRLAGNGVLDIGRTRGPVLELNVDREEDVDDKPQRQDGNHRSYEEVRVHKFACQTIEVGGYESGEVERQMHGDEDQQEQAAKAHYQFFTD